MNQTPKSLFPYYEKVDLSYRENWREYIFSNGERVRIDSPQYLIISDNGHRVMDNRIAHYIPYGWIELIWYPKEGYGFYCEGDDEIDPAEDEPEKMVVMKSDPPQDSLIIHDSDIAIIRDRLNDLITPSVDAFLRFFKDQLNNANRNNSTIEFQTLIRIKEKFLNLFQSWIGEENDSEEELEQSSTESTE